MFKIKTAIAAAALAVTGAAASAQSIVDIAVSDDRFSTLVAAVTAADLVFNFTHSVFSQSFLALPKSIQPGYGHPTNSLLSWLGSRGATTSRFVDASGVVNWEW